ncbi:MAG: alkaline phosphatase family protein [Janthinobacterium lividum]
MKFFRIKQITVLGAVAVGTAAFAAPSQAQNLLGVTQGPNAALYSINTVSGATSQIGGLLPTGADISALTYSSGSLFAGTVNGSIYQIDPNTGAAVLLGGTGNSNAIHGLATLGGSLYGLQGDASAFGVENLYQISLGSAISETVVGQVNDANLLTGQGLTVFNNSLVTADSGLGAGGYLFSLDPTTGNETTLDTTGGSSPGLSENGIDSLAVLDGALFAVDNDPSVPDYALYQVDPGTTATSDRVGLGGLRFGAIAAVPEMSTSVGFIIGLGILLLIGGFARKSRKSPMVALLPILALLPLAAQAQSADPTTYPPTTTPTVLPLPPNNPDLASAQDNQLVTGKRLTLTPLGTQTNVASMPYNMVLSPDGKYAVSTDTGFREFLIALRTSNGTEASSLSFNGKNPTTNAQEGLFYGLVFSPTVNADGTYTLYAAQGNENTIAILTLSSAGLLTDTGKRFHGNTPVSSLNGPLGVAPLDTPSGLSLDSRGYLYVSNNDPALPTLPGSISVYDTNALPLPTEVGRYTFPFATFGPTNYPLSIAALPGGQKIFVGSERDGQVYVLSANYPGFATPASPQLIGAIATGSHPLGLTFSKDYSKLYVANAQSDTVSVVTTATNAVAATILLRPDGARGLPGVTPDNLALSPDGKTLYATLADMNAVAVIDTGRNRLLGYIPVGWYPTSAVVSPDNLRLLVTNAKGHYTRYPNPEYGTTLANSNSISTYNENMIEGDVQTIPIPSVAALAQDTQQTIANNRITPLTDNPSSNPLASIGLQAGKIKHVLYIVKENRTYDQILGDLKNGPDDGSGNGTGSSLGNGDPSLSFGEGVTPNLHALARRFVLLDNYYEGGEVSEDGWNWSTQGMANQFTQKNVPYNYSGRQDFTQTDFQGQNNGYPVGGFPATDVDGKVNSFLFPSGAPAIPDVAQTPGGYIWDNVKKAKLAYRNFGVDLSTGAAGLIPDNYPTHTNLHPEGHDLAGISDYDFRHFDTDYSDSEAPYYYTYGAYPALPASGSAYATPTGTSNALFNETQYGKYKAPSRFSEFKREFNEMTAGNTTDSGVPSFMIMTLMSDHTQGSRAGGATNPRIHTPKSMIADDDYGVGQMVDLISRSPAWSSTAIFVIEDDSQDGPDHVDCHRSICYVISPWIKQNSIDHHFYNTDSVLKTMELLLGLPAMNQYDAVADPILDFDTSPSNSMAYSAILPAKSIISDLNPSMTALSIMDHRSVQYQMAMLSNKMDFKHPDAAPDELLNQIIWKSIMGWNKKMPAPVHGLTLTLAHSAKAHTTHDSDD